MRKRRDLNPNPERLPDTNDPTYQDLEKQSKGGMRKQTQGEQTWRHGQEDGGQDWMRRQAQEPEQSPTYRPQASYWQEPQGKPWARWEPVKDEYKPGSDYFAQHPDQVPGPRAGYDPAIHGKYDQYQYSRSIPNYAPNYWDDPQRVSRYYQALENAAPGDGEDVHPWLAENADNIRTAYEYMKFRNQDKPWYLWDYLPETDPGREYLAGLQQPPDEMLLWNEQRYATGQPWVPAGSFDPGQAYTAQFGGPDGQPGDMQLGGLTQAQYDELPTWQKWALGIFGGVAPEPLQPFVDAVGPGTISAATLGGALGIMGGPMGMAGGVAIGAGLGRLVERNPKLADWLMYLDYPANWLEQALGVGGIIRSIPRFEDPGDRMEALQKVLQDLPSAWQASRLAYELEPTGFGGSEGVWNLGTAELTPMDENQLGYGGWWEAFDRIQSGESPEAVYQEISARTGFSGMSRDLLGHIILDPLNVVGAFALEPVQLIARLTGNDALTAATRIAHGPVEAAQAYGQLLRVGSSADEIGQLGAVSRWLAGVADPANGLDAMRLKLKGLDPQTAVRTGEAGRLVDVALSPIGAPTKLSKLAGALTTGGLGTAVGWGLAGPVGGAIGGGLLARYGWGKGLGFLSNLTPAARAQEVTGNGALNMALVLERAQTPDEMVRLVKGMGNTPLDVARELSMKTLEAPEGAAVPMMLRDFGDKADDMLTAYHATDAQRAMLEGIAEVTGRTPAQVLTEIKRGGAQAEGLLRQYVDTAKEITGRKPQATGQIDNALRSEADNLIRAYEAGDLTPEVLRGYAKSFLDDGLPYSDEMFRAQLYSGMVEHSATWAADWFGVTPEPGMIRLANTVKSAQSLALLGLNPMYFVNNVINNLVTSAASGVFGLRSQDNIVKLWERVGVTPERLRQGLGVALDGQGAVTFDAIREAQRAGDMLDKAQDILRVANDKVGVFSNLSAKLEGWSSAQTFTAGFSQAWGRLWKRGVGYDPMPATLERALDAIDPNLKGLVYDAIEGGLNQREIEAALWSGVTQRSVDAFLPDVAARYGMSAADASELLQHSGAKDFLRERLDVGRDLNQREIVRAFNDLEEFALREMNAQRRAALVDEAAHVAERVKSEGAGAALELHNRLALEKMATRAQDVSEWQKIFAQRDLVEPGVYRAMIDDQVARERARYAVFNENESSTYLGIANALGFESGLSRGFVDSLVRVQDTWKGFYKEKWELTRRYFNTNYESKEASGIAWDKLQQRINEMGNAARDSEISAASEMAQTFGEMFRLQYGDDAGRIAAQWYEGVVTTRFELGVEFSKFYDDLLAKGITGGPARDRAFDAFWQKTWLPKLMEQTNKNLAGADEMYRFLTGDGGRGTVEQVVPGGGAPGSGGGMGSRAEGVTPQTAQPAVQVMITRAMREKLDALGWRKDQVRELTPARAAEIIEQGQYPGQDVFAVAREFGLDALDENGQPKPGADFHIFAIASRYGGDEMAGVRSFDDLLLRADGADLMRRALEERKTYQDAYGEYTGVTARTPWGTVREPQMGSRAQREQALADSAARIEQALQEDVYGRNLDEMQTQGQVVTELIDTPRGEMPEGISQEMANQAALMLNELGSGQAERIYTSENIGQTGEASYTRASSNAGWYSQLSAEGYRNRKSVAGALGRIIEDAGKDRIRANETTLPRVKALIIERMMGDADSGAPPHPGLLLLMGREDDAVDAMRQYWDTPEWAQAATDDDWLQLAGSPEALDLLFARLGERTFGDTDLLSDTIPPSAVDGARAMEEARQVADLQDAVAQRERIQMRADEWQATIDGQLDLLKGDPDLTREFMHQGMTQVWGLTQDQADVWLRIMDARSRAWARETGRTAKEFWSEYMGGMVESNADILEGGLAQRVAAGTDVKAAVTFAEDGRAVLHALGAQDFSSLVHETGHVFRRTLGDVDARIAAEWAGAEAVQNAESGMQTYRWAEAAEEKFARGFERWITEGDAAAKAAGFTDELVQVFEKFKRWMLEIYNSIRGTSIDVEISPEMRGVFERMLAEDLPEGVAPLYQRGKKAQPGQMDMFAGGEDLPLFSGAAQRADESVFKPQEIEGRQLGMFGPEQWFDTDAGKRRLLKKPDEIATPTARNDVLFQNSDGTVGEMVRDGQAPQGAGLPIGTVASLENQPPVQQMSAEAWNEKLWPMLQDIRAEMLGPQGKAPTSLKGANLDPASMREVRAYLAKVQGQMGDTKLAAMRWGENRRDAALLNYSRRYGFDNALSAVYPYQFWMTRSVGQWALRALDRPAWLANYARLQTMGERVTQQPGFPTRLEGKMRMPVPFLPEWAGGGVYVDPWHQLFPFTMLASPYDRMQENADNYEKRAGYVLQGMVANGEITEQQARQAYQQRDGQLWTQVLNEAKVALDGEESNPFAFMNLISSPMLPVDIGAKMLTGRADEIGQLPMTRTWQALTAGLKPGGYNLEGPLRRALGMPERGQMGDFYVDRELANLVAEGAITLEMAQQAMLNRQGAAFDMALDRVGKQQAAKTLGGAALWLDFFPEGEQEQRKLQQVFSAAIDSGDPEAVSKFFDEYPEYQARLMAMDWDDPEQRMRQFLISQVWNGYGDVSDLHRRQITEQLGPAFSDAFLNKDTRSYESIDTDTLASWAKVFNGGEDATPGGLKLQLAPENESALYELYQQEKGQRFPQLSALQQMYYGLENEQERAKFVRRFPQLQEYWNWKTQVQAEQPELIPHLTSPESDLYGVDRNTAQAVYEFRATREQYFPGVFDLQSEYFALPQAQRRGYMQAHPELGQYWEWRRSVLEAYPEIEPYVTSRESMADLAEQTGVQVDPSTWSPPLLSQVMQSALTGEQLGAGARRNLRLMWEREGQPLGDFDAWLAEVVGQLQ